MLDKLHGDAKIDPHMQAVLRCPCDAMADTNVATTAKTGDARPSTEPLRQDFNWRAADSSTHAGLERSSVGAFAG